MDFREIQRIQQELKRAQEIQKQLKQLQDLKKILDQVQEIKRQQEIIRQFIEEHKADWWKGDRSSALSPETLESLREQAGYDKEMWSAIVRELLGEPPPSVTS